MSTFEKVMVKFVLDGALIVNLQSVFGGYLLGYLGDVTCPEDNVTVRVGQIFIALAIRNRYRKKIYYLNSIGNQIE